MPKQEKCMPHYQKQIQIYASKPNHGLKSKSEKQKNQARGARNILNPNSSSTMRKVAGDIIMDPTLSSFPGGVESFEHGIRDARGDSNVGARESLQHERVGIKELDFGDVVGLQELHHLGCRERVGRHGTPVDPNGSSCRPKEAWKCENQEQY